MLAATQRALDPSGPPLKGHSSQADIYDNEEVEKVGWPYKAKVTLEDALPVQGGHAAAGLGPSSQCTATLLPARELEELKIVGKVAAHVAQCCKEHNKGAAHASVHWRHGPPRVGKQRCQAAWVDSKVVGRVRNCFPIRQCIHAHPLPELFM